MFGLKVFRHRWFAASHLVLAPSHPSHKSKRLGVGGMCCVAGHGGQSSGYGNYSRRIPADHRRVSAWKTAMGIDWMTRDELAQAVPPAYTEYLGRQMLEVLA
jgi:DNA (cytosine-5)-methyltransferase 1